jgi:uncharacterized protein
MLTLNSARAWYPDYDAVHGFDHIKRVYALCERIGPHENADMEILRAAALLHDASGSHPGDGKRADHHIRSAAFAGSILAEEGWDVASIEAVKHCILTHRFRKNDPPTTIEAKVLFDADKLDVIGAIGVVRALAYAFQVKAPAYADPSDHFLQTGETLPDEAHSAYHEYLYKLRHISSLFFTETGRSIGSERQAFLNAFFDTLKDENRLNP